MDQDYDELYRHNNEHTLWTQVCTLSIEKGHDIEHAINAANKALLAYRAAIYSDAKS